ncbi:MAG: response regulator, partial [Erysipelotrichaceae bacterium]|nr:response regulator [Erysipelotrichaceae bacterium]
MEKTAMMKVLVVDNEVEFASTLATRLKLCKVQAECAFSGTAALEALPVFLPDVIVLDLQMQDLTGLEVLAHIKAIDQSIEVILLTGQGSFDVGIKSMEL